ncbi:unnamed protein product, partial [Discosporangium mesarthrocarpum]
ADETRYGVPFRSYRPDPELLGLWCRAGRNPSLQLPPPNPFIPDDFSLVCD